MSFAHLIRTSRTARSLTQKQLAQSLQVDHSAVSGWESGRRHPKPEHLSALAEALEWTPDQIAEALLS